MIEHEQSPRVPTRLLLRRRTGSKPQTAGSIEMRHSRRPSSCPPILRLTDAVGLRSDPRCVRGGVSPEFRGFRPVGFLAWFQVTEDLRSLDGRAGPSLPPRRGRRVPPPRAAAAPELRDVSRENSLAVSGSRCSSLAAGRVRGSLHFKPLSVRGDLATGATAPQASVGVRVLLGFWTVPSEPG
jgi:hypothetical protein